MSDLDLSDLDDIDLDIDDEVDEMIKESRVLVGSKRPRATNAFDEFALKKLERATARKRELQQLQDHAQRQQQKQEESLRRQLEQRNQQQQRKQEREQRQLAHARRNAPLSRNVLVPVGPCVDRPALAIRDDTAYVRMGDRFVEVRETERSEASLRALWHAVVHNTQAPLLARNAADRLSVLALNTGPRESKLERAEYLLRQLTGFLHLRTDAPAPFAPWSPSIDLITTGLSRMIAATPYDGTGGHKKEDLSRAAAIVLAALQSTADLLYARAHSLSTQQETVSENTWQQVQAALTCVLLHCCLCVLDERLLGDRIMLSGVTRRALEASARLPMAARNRLVQETARAIRTTLTDSVALISIYLPLILRVSALFPVSTARALAVSAYPTSGGLGGVVAATTSTGLPGAPGCTRHRHGLEGR
ncbi:MAG: hypothetical protein MHM6MM_005060 [Cercozoa sp. M6MM]